MDHTYTLDQSCRSSQKNFGLLKSIDHHHFCVCVICGNSQHIHRQNEIFFVQPIQPLMALLWCHLFWENCWLNIYRKQKMKEVIKDIRSEYFSLGSWQNLLNIFGNLLRKCLAICQRRWKRFSFYFYINTNIKMEIVFFSFNLLRKLMMKFNYDLFISMWVIVLRAILHLSIGPKIFLCSLMRNNCLNKFETLVEETG